MRTKEQQIEFWKEQYHYVKDIVDRIDQGENVHCVSIKGIEMGQRAACVDEANIAVDRLVELGNFDLTKIE